MSSSLDLVALRSGCRPSGEYLGCVTSGGAVGLRRKGLSAEASAADRVVVDGVWRDAHRVLSSALSTLTVLGPYLRRVGLDASAAGECLAVGQLSAAQECH